MSINYRKIITDYIKSLNQEILLTKCFNEKSFQHELGQYLQNQIGNNYLVQYERNAKYFNCTKGNAYFDFKNNKKELDIVILKKTNNITNLINQVPECSIEIKYQKYYIEDLSKTAASPTKTLYEHLRDIELIEQCKLSGFRNTFSIFLADHPFCYEERKNKVKYECLHNAYRGTNSGISIKALNEINNEIKNIGQWRTLNISNNYDLKWNDLLSYVDENGHKLNLKYILEYTK